jgi:hypothetical protein
MAVDGNFTISYGATFSAGGSSDTYQLLGPHVVSRDYNKIRLVFEVVVVSTSYAGLKTACETLEDEMRKRDQNFIINIGGSTFSYTHGTDVWNTYGSATKSGDRETDVGFSRAYTCEVTGDLASDGTDGPLLEIEKTVDYDVNRAIVASMSGVYTADSSAAATANYLANADAEWTSFQATLPGSRTFELVDEQYTADRNDSRCQWTRQYHEVLASQTQAALDDTRVKDFRMSFTDLSQHPGDSEESVYRMRRVVGTYDCAMDIGVFTTGDLKGFIEDTVFPHVKALFEQNFQPQVFAVEDHRYSSDRSAQRVSVSVQFVYQKDGGDDVVELTQTMSYREQRNLDQTPIHLDDEFAAEVDPGWSILQRIATRTVVVIGDESPKRRIGRTPDEGLAGPIKMPGNEPPAGPRVVQDGWNLVSNTSQTQERWIGDPAETQIKTTVLTETVVEQWNSKPGTRTSSRTRNGPITGPR